MNMLRDEVEKKLRKRVLNLKHVRPCAHMKDLCYVCIHDKNYEAHANDS